MNEFELISQYFTRQQRDDVVLGIGDDAAILSPPAEHELLVTTDTLIAGVHFPAGTSAYDVGYKSLAVNLSDLAAMGATPAWATLALTISECNNAWLNGFAEGFFTLAEQHHVSLVGGDTTRGALSITVQCTGFVKTGQAVRRSGARPGDLLFVSGSIGDGWLGLQTLQGRVTLTEKEQQAAQLKLNRPTPRVSLGKMLQGNASSMIDISDGLLADLQHILTASGCAAELEQQRMPLSLAARQYLANDGELLALLTGGDDFELCFTLPAERQLLAQSFAKQAGCPITCIGRILEGTGIALVDEKGSQPLTAEGYRHF